MTLLHRNGNKQRVKMAKTIVFTLKFSDNVTCVLQLPRCRVCMSIKVLLGLTLRLYLRSVI